MKEFIWGKKYTLCFFALLLFCAITAIISLNGNPSKIAVQTFQEGRVPVLIIDAGHGGEDGGASSADGLLESAVNLAVAQKLESIISFLGMQTAMTRNSQSLDYPEGLTIAQKKAWDQNNRITLINSIPDAVLLSIHQNSYPDPRPRGTQALYAVSDDSKLFAEILHNNLNAELYPNNRRVAAPISNTIFLMKHAKCTAVLVECGFLSNASDTEKLRSDNHQTKLSLILASSYIQYIST